MSSCSWFNKSQETKAVISKSVPKAVVSEFGPSRKNAGWFTDVTEDYGLKGIKAVHTYAVDLDNDGFTDIITLASNASEPEFYFWNATQKKFEKSYNPFLEGVRASFLLFYDFDKDGIKDVLVGVLNAHSELTKVPLKIFRGSLTKKRRLSYIEVKGAIPMDATATASVSVLDYNLDGNLDLYIGNWFEKNGENYISLPDRLYEGNKFKFSESSGLLTGEHFLPSNSKVYVNAKPTFATSTCDMDQNGFPDVLTASSNGHHNKLWMNIYDFKDRGRYFQDYGQESGYASDMNGLLDPLGGGNAFFSACSDYNNDGYMDLYVGVLSHSYDNESRDRSSILTGAKGTFPPGFIRTEYTNEDESGKWDQGDRSGVWIDVNFDGLRDLLVDNSGFPPKSRLILLFQYPDHSFEDLGMKAGLDIVNPEGTVVLDINKDGKPDVLTGQSNVRNGQINNHLYLFRNDLPYKDKKILRTYLSGKRSNKAGVGAMVILKFQKKKGQVTQRQFVEYSSGPQPSQSEEGLFWGWDSSYKLTDATIRWPIFKDDQFNSFQEKQYDLKKINFTDFTQITFCENGQLVKGNKNCP
ncbi:MAG: FG-GAP repeat domain-containing protein [Bacteriovoracaceae bacterium]